MDIETAEVSLYLRKYQWALNDFTREIKEGCPFLKTLSNPSVKAFLIYMQQFTATEQLQLSLLIMKSWYFPAIQLLGEELTRDDQVLIKKCRAEIRSIVLPTASDGYPVTKTFPVKRAEVAKIVLLFLSSAFGTKPEKFESLNWFYTTIVGDWNFYTRLDFSGTWGTEIRCHYQLVRNDSKSWGLLTMPLSSAIGPIRISQSFSLLSLYGLSSDVHYIGNIDDVHYAAQSILATYQRLVQAVPEWVDGLDSALDMR